MKIKYILLFLVSVVAIGCNGNYPTNTDNSKDDSYNIENNPYISNRLRTGDIPYRNERMTNSKNSTIKVKTQVGTSSQKIDYVIIVKRRNKIVRNAYIQAGDEYTFNVPKGTYQVFFYSGRGWNPNKKMHNGIKGGFVADGSFSKDDPVAMDYNSLEYELIPQVNGNFSEKSSSEEEVF